MSDPTPIFLVFRQKTGCRQYPFDSPEALRKWLCRKPYSEEYIRIQTYSRDGFLINDWGPHPAALAVARIDAQTNGAFIQRE